jgi:uncharacterized protein with gpF-like domain
MDAYICVMAEEQEKTPELRSENEEEEEEDFDFSEEETDDEGEGDTMEDSVEENENEMEEDEEEYWEFVENQMRLFRHHFPVLSAQHRYNVSNELWERMLKDAQME